MGSLKTKVCITGMFLVSAGSLSAQHDSTYYVSYARRLTTRLYLSQKYTSLFVRNRKENYTLTYLPNTTLNLGVGASYKWATLNLAYGFGFLNHDDERGKTKYLDLQFHGYGERFNLDFVGQFYKGFYLFPRGVAGPNQYYIRPDLKVNAIGISYQYIFNHRRFSFRSSAIQTEWQKKSAGTPLLGIEVYAGRVRSDSSIVPSAISKTESSLEETRMFFFELGPNIGYAYTWVFQQHFFLTGSASASFDYGFSTIRGNQGDHSRFAISPNTFLRIGSGYNSEFWAFSVVYVNNGVRIAGGSSTTNSMLNVGNVRINCVHRFAPSKKERKVLETIIK